MTKSIEFPEYGGEGNKADARRMRRSFRLCVFVVVFFTVALWFAERYLAHDLAETQYVAGLTLAPESARSFLRSAVKHDTQKNQTPNVKYLQALAEREEKDLILPVYRQAHELDPTDPFLALRYGCQLFAAEEYSDAANMFRHTRNHPPKNALSGYLEAAAMASAAPTSDLSESIALVAKTNENNAPIIFPAPLWSQDLPERGYWYQKLQRQAAEECLQPINVYVDRVIDQAKARIAVKHIQSWDAWLQTLQTMGQRILESPSQGSIQAIVGIRIQLAAIELRQQIHALEAGEPDTQLAERYQKLRAALKVLNDFEATRDPIIEAHKASYILPLKILLLTMIILVGCYLAATAIAAMARTGKTAWDLPHSKLGIGVIALANLAFLMLLTTMSGLQARLPSGLTGLDPWLHNVQTVWWTLLAAMGVFGAWYPALRLPGVSAIIGRNGLSTDAGMHKTAKRRHRIAYCSFMRRYYGIACGLFVAVVATWVIGYRIFLMIYPWQIEILVTGLHAEEARAVTSALAMLG